MGFYFPETIVDTEDVANEINLSEKFYRNIGVKKIFKPSEKDHPSKMAYESAVNALNDAGTAPEKIDMIITAVFKNDYLHWQMGAWLKDKLNAKNAVTLEVKGGCGAHFQAVELAVDQIKASSGINTVLVICAERLYGYGWPTFLSSGGQSILIKRDCEQFNYIGFATNNFIAYHNMAHIPHGGTASPFTQEIGWEGDSFVENVTVDKDMYLKHIKPVVFCKFADVTEDILRQTGYLRQDIDYMVTLVQQQNFDERILKAIGIPDVPNANEFKSDLGHFSGADSYILLDKARKAQKIKKGDLILKIVLGGVSWFASLIRY